MKIFDISGETKVVAIFADPINQVQTPKLMNRLFRQADVDAICIPFEVTSANLQSVLASCKHIKSLVGAVVTVPHKINIVNYCDEKGDRAASVGAINAIRFNESREIVGDMFDGLGFVTGLLRNNVVLTNDTKVYLAGAGGVARGIAFSLIDQGIEYLEIYNRTTDKAEVLIQELKNYAPHATIKLGTNAPENMDLCINGTSIGMIGLDDKTPFSLENLSADTCIAEVVMKPDVTLLLEKAGAKGMPIIKGTEMLKAQISQLAAFVLNDNTLLDIHLEL